MLEACYCGRMGELEDREPVTTADGEKALRCPECGHMDYLKWLLEPDRVFEDSYSKIP